MLLKNVKIIDSENFRYKSQFYQNHKENFFIEIGSKRYIYNKNEDPLKIYEDAITRSLEDFLNGKF